LDNTLTDISRKTVANIDLTRMAKSSSDTINDMRTADVHMSSFLLNSDTKPFENQAANIAIWATLQIKLKW